jgi:hypothetical protein
MKNFRVAALSALSLAAALSLTACNGDDLTNSSSAGSSTASSSTASNAGSSSDGATTQGGGSAAKGGAGSGDSAQGGNNSQGGSGKGAAAGTAAQSGSKVSFCKTSNLDISAVNAAPGGSEGRVNITMVNRGSTTCSATGFAGVDITDADHTTSSVERSSSVPRITTLKPGQSAIFDIAYTVDNSGNALTSPTSIQVTPPNETHTVTLDWPSDAAPIKDSYVDVKVYPTHNND